MPSGMIDIVAAGFNRWNQFCHHQENAAPQASAIKADRHDPHMVFKHSSLFYYCGCLNRYRSS